MLYSMFLLAVLFQNYNDVKEIIYFLYPDLRQWQPDEKVGEELRFISTSDYVNAYVTHLHETSHMSAEFVFRYGPKCMGGVILPILVLLHL